MSDNLSEAEINALQKPESDNLSPALEDFLRVYRRTMPSFAAALGNQVGKKCFISDPQGQLVSPADVLPDEMVSIEVNFRGAYSGLHNYYLHTAEALSIAQPVMGVESLELDDTALSAIGEGFAKAVGAQLSAIEKEFNENLVIEGAPNVQLTAKAALNLVAPVVTLTYDINFDAEKAFSVIEVMNPDLAESIGKLLHQEETMANSASQKKSETPRVEGVRFPGFRVAELGPQEEQNLGLLMDVPVTLAVELGRTKWQLRDVLTIGEGSIIELEKQAGEPVDLLVNNHMIARGEVVVVDENFSVRITEIITSFEQLMQKGI